MPSRQKCGRGAGDVLQIPASPHATNSCRISSSSAKMTWAARWVRCTKAHRHSNVRQLKPHIALRSLISRCRNHVVMRAESTSATGKAYHTPFNCQTPEKSSTSGIRKRPSRWPRRDSSSPRHWRAHGRPALYAGPRPSACGVMPLSPSARGRIYAAPPACRSTRHAPSPCACGGRSEHGPTPADRGGESFCACSTGCG